MLRIISNKRLRALLQEAYELGVVTAIDLGYRLGRRDSRGFITGSKMDQQIDEILKGMGA